MKLSELESLGSFALLGPGFGEGRCLFIRELQEAKAGEPLLAFVPFEADGSSALCFAGKAEQVEVQLETPRPLEVVFEAPQHAHKVEQIREAIARGDVYQVCLTERAYLPKRAGSELVSLLSARGMARYLAWVRLPNGEEFVSGSPELFFETNGRRVHVEPMKGTAPPGTLDALSASQKDRAELAMITDLLRNDLTPICVPRSVRVENERRVLELPYALQTVSDVAGELLEGVGPLEVLRALHPGGSVTGAPKKAAIEHLRALESSPRGAYCGALGLCWKGRSTFSLLIRTAQRTPEGWTYGVGGGIVFDSEPAKEFEELQVKLGALKWPTRS